MLELKQHLHIQFLQHAPGTVCYEIVVDHKLLMWSSLSHCEIIMLIIGFSMHASAQLAPALFMRHTIAAQVPRAIFSSSGEIIHSCSWTAKGFSLSLWGLPYSISLVKSRDHGGWMLRHKSDNQVQHIMQILILQREKRSKEEKSLEFKLQQKEKKNLLTVKLYAGCILNTGDTHLLKYWL